MHLQFYCFVLFKRGKLLNRRIAVLFFDRNYLNRNSFFVYNGELEIITRIVYSINRRFLTSNLVKGLKAFNRNEFLLYPCQHLDCCHCLQKKQKQSLIMSDIF